MQIWVFTFLSGGIEFLGSYPITVSSRHYGSLFAYKTFLCHAIYVILKKIIMQEVDFIFAIAVLIMSVVIHEVSHGYMANALGDPTAKYAGRLTLNPVKHLDFFGSFVVPIITYLLGGIIFGWAKPVPYNPYNLKNQKWGPAMVGAAGPVANFIVAIFFGILIRLGSLYGLMSAPFIKISIMIVFINIILGIFNLIPIPPLDGSKVLFAFFPYQWRHIEEFLERYGFFIILIFIFFFLDLIFPLILLIFRLLTGVSF